MNTRITKLEVSQEDFTCPITQDIFFDVACTSPCGHPFERSAITKHYSTNKKCPQCKCTIEKISEVQPLFRVMLESFLAQNEDLNKKRYFSVELFKYEFKHLDTDASRRRIEKIFDHVKKYPELLPELLNEPDEYTKENELIKLVEQQEGIDLIIKYPELLDLITEKGLNLVGSDGNAPLTWFAAHPQFKKNLIHNKLFLSKINFQGLNALDNKFNDSAVFWLAIRNSYLFVENPELINLIEKNALNKICFQPESYWGTSPLYWILKNDYQLIKQSTHLKNSITYEGLLGLNKKNKKIKISEWKFLSQEELKELINKMIAKNSGLRFLLEIFENIVSTENVTEIVNALKTKQDIFLENAAKNKENESDDADETDDEDEEDEEEEEEERSAENQAAASNITAPIERTSEINATTVSENLENRSEETVTSPAPVSNLPLSNAYAELNIFNHPTISNSTENTANNNPARNL